MRDLHEYLRAYWTYVSTNLGWGKAVRFALVWLAGMFAPLGVKTPVEFPLWMAITWMVGWSLIGYALQILHPSRLIDLKAAIFLAPAVAALLRDPGVPARDRGRFTLHYRRLNLTKQRHNLLRTEPFLQHDQLLSELFSHKVWSKKARSGHSITNIAESNFRYTHYPK